MSELVPEVWEPHEVSPNWRGQRWILRRWHRACCSFASYMGRSNRVLRYASREVAQKTADRLNARKD